MEFKEGANVYTADGERVGEITRIVLEPDTHEVTHLVVEKGFIFTEDKVVPMSLVGPAREDRITLREDAGDLEMLPNFEESYYVAAETLDDSENLPRHRIGPLYSYPPIGTNWSTGYFNIGAGPEFIEETIRNIPENTVALEEGARVISSDQEHVGDIERVFTSMPEERVTHLLISSGFILKEHKLVPVTWINHVTEYEVHLSVSSAFVKDLPDYQADA